MILEFIEGTIGIDIKWITNDQLIKSLLEFNLIFFDGANEYMIPPKKIISNPPLGVIIALFSHCFPRLGILSLIKCLFLLVKCIVFEEKKDIFLLLHKDLTNAGNKITGYNRNIYFLDFEQTCIEQKWILIDIVDLAFSIETLEIDTTLLNEYLKEIKPFFMKPINVKNQVRFALLRKVTNLIAYDDKNCNVYSSFLLDILLDDISYDNWFMNNCMGTGDKCDIPQQIHQV